MNTFIYSCLHDWEPWRQMIHYSNMYASDIHCSHICIHQYHDLHPSYAQMHPYTYGQRNNSTLILSGGWNIILYTSLDRSYIRNVIKESQAGHGVSSRRPTIPTARAHLGKWATAAGKVTVTCQWWRSKPQMKIEILGSTWKLQFLTRCGIMATVSWRGCFVSTWRKVVNRDVHEKCSNGKTGPEAGS